MSRRLLSLLLLAALPLAATQQTAPTGGASSPAPADRQQSADLAGQFLFAAGHANAGPSVRDSAQRIHEWLNRSAPAPAGDAAAPAVFKLEPLFLWAIGQADSERLPRTAFQVGERLYGWGLFTGRASASGGLDLALSGEVLIAVRSPSGEPLVRRHDFSLRPLLTLPVDAGAEIFILPLGRGTLLESGRLPLSLGATALNPLFPFELLGLNAEPAGRSAIIHFETDHEQNVVRFELQRSARPEAGWRTVAQMPATGGGDYHVIDTHFPGRAYYRVVPVLDDGLRAAPSMLLSVGGGPAR